MTLICPVASNRVFVGFIGGEGRMANAFVLCAGDRYRKAKEEGRPPEELQILKDVANELYVSAKLRHQRAHSANTRLNYLDE